MSGLGPPGAVEAASGVRDGELAALLARVEQAEGPDRELDALIANEIGEQSEFPGSHLMGGFSGGRQKYLMIVAPAYTASLDAALALCAHALPGWRPRIDNRGITPGHEWLVTLAWWEKRRFAWGRTAPLALIAAMLKTLIATGQDDTSDRQSIPGRHSSES